MCSLSGNPVKDSAVSNSHVYEKSISCQIFANNANIPDLTSNVVSTDTINADHITVNTLTIAG